VRETASMTTYSARERTALADALDAAGPDAATLCEGWSTRDLAAHLVLRERRPDAAAGMVLEAVPALKGHTDRLMRQTAQRAYPELVDQFRTGPQRASLLALPGADARVNLAEHFIHHEDVRRAAPGWAARVLSPGHEAALWGACRLMARRSFLRSAVGVVLVVPDGPRATVRRGSSTMVLTGLASELLLYVAGRQDQAEVLVAAP